MFTNFFAMKVTCKFTFFRIGGDWSFDDDAANNYGATVRSFDPT